MRLAEAALGLPDGYFMPSYAKPGTLLRLAYYPATAGIDDGDDGAGDGTWRYGAHTDYDGFTILQRGDVAGPSDMGDGAGSGGLEIEWPDGVWRPQPATHGELTINIGDLLSRWTNNRWKATKHRVAPPPKGSAAAKRDRLSVVYFTGPHPDTVVQCLPSCAPPPGQPTAFEPITARAHVQSKIEAAVGVIA